MKGYSTTTPEEFTPVASGKTSGKSSGKSPGERDGLGDGLGEMSGKASGKMSGEMSGKIVRPINRLKADEIIGRVGPAKGGHWEILK